MTKILFAALGAATLAFSPIATQAEPILTGGVYEVVSTHGADTISVGEMHLFNRRAFETPPNARNAGGFLSIYNYSSTPNRLVSASSPIAERVELHTMSMENDVMRMREVEGGIELPGEAQVDLEPGGLHVMFIGITQPFAEGDEVSVTLTFEGGEEREITFPVRARSMDMNHGSDDGDMDHSEMDHGEMDHDDDHSAHGSTN
ncbi:MAG: copper chaperone PCu(A)C [Devosiaceae bacterium]